MASRILYAALPQLISGATMTAFKSSCRHLRTLAMAGSDEELHQSLCLQGRPSGHHAAYVNSRQQDSCSSSNGSAPDQKCMQIIHHMQRQARRKAKGG